MEIILGLQELETEGFGSDLMPISSISQSGGGERCTSISQYC